MSEPTTNYFVGREMDAILVAATEATVRSRMYEQAFADRGMMIHSIVISELASAIERNATKEELRKIIQPTIEYAIALKCKTLIFGCTQFPFARSVFETLFFERAYPIHLFDPADAIAKEVLNQFSVKGKGEQEFFTSKASVIFDEHVRTRFGSSQFIQCVLN